MRRFYGGTHDEWLDLPPRWLLAYDNMRQRIEAEDALTAAQIEFLPYLKTRKQKEVIEKWEREAKKGAAAHDKHGREVVDSVDEFNAWLRSMQVI